MKQRSIRACFCRFMGVAKVILTKFEFYRYFLHTEKRRENSNYINHFGDSHDSRCRRACSNSTTTKTRIDHFYTVPCYLAYECILYSRVPYILQAYIVKLALLARTIGYYTIKCTVLIG